MSQQPRRERQRERANGKERRRHKAEISFLAHYFLRPFDETTRVGLTDLPRNANRYIYYTREPSPGATRRRSFRQHSHERVPTRSALCLREMKEVGGRAELFIRDECMNNAKICVPCIKLLLPEQNLAGTLALIF